MPPEPVSRVYGDANSINRTATANNLVNGDTVTSVGLASPATAASNLGAYALTGSAALGSGLENYAIDYAARTGGPSVAPRGLAITADAQGRVYGDGNPVLTYQIGGAGLVNGDVLTGGLGTAATIASGVGVYGITLGSGW